MSSKNNAQPAARAIHMLTASRNGQGNRGVLHYWPILLFVLLSALTQTVGGLF